MGRTREPNVSQYAQVLFIERVQVLAGKRIYENRKQACSRVEAQGRVVELSDFEEGDGEPCCRVGASTC